MIVVVGLGFVGLTSALGFAEKGMMVRGYDVNRTLVNKLLAGDVPFYEPRLQEKLEKHLNGNFMIPDDLAAALQDSEVIMFCVGTPSQPDGSVDLSHLQDAITAVVRTIDASKFRVLCVKSTVPPTTAAGSISALLKVHGLTPGVHIGLASNPEFLREGYAWDDFMNPDRLVIGTADTRSRDIVDRLYRPFGVPIHHVGLNDAEFIKYSSNALLASFVSFANELSMIAHRVGGIDVKRAFAILHEDRRWHGSPAGMSSYVFPGCGFGGYCLPKDTAALVASAHSFGLEVPLLKAVLTVNEQITRAMVDRIACNVRTEERLAILGLSFKPGSDDVRVTPAAQIISELLVRGYSNLVGYDPISVTKFQDCYSFPIEYAHDVNTAVSTADAVVLVTAWPEFKQNQQLFQSKKVFDLRYYL